VNNQIVPAALVVDDNYFNRDLCKLALEHVGYTVTEAENGLEAVNLLNQHRYDLLLLDLAMPEMDGPSVIRAIRQKMPHPRMCIVVMTANPHMAMHEEVELNADYVMYKPIDVVAFSKLLERLRNSRQPAP
jgi:CheY-like chemotaxis protein